MAFKKYPQPPFKKYIKTELGDILETRLFQNMIEPATFSKKTGRPLFQFGWTVTYTKLFKDGSGTITFCPKIIATEDTKEDLL